MTKVEYDPIFKTQAQNSIKLVRIVRCKNENLHAALKQKYQILDSVLELSYLDPLFQSDSSPSKYTAVAAVCCGLYNIEHPGFPVVFLQEHQKIGKAEQILMNFMRENFLLHLDFPTGWKTVPLQQVHDQFDFPYIDHESKICQLYEVTTSVHALLKGQQVASHLRGLDVDAAHAQDFTEFKALMKLPPEDIVVQFLKLTEPPAKYSELEEAGVLPVWPGSGTLFRITCAPSNKSDIDKRNWKFPTVFILDDSSLNPLNFSDIFKTVGNFNCYNCPSVNGGIAGCCHIGFLFMLLSAPYLLDDQSTSKPVKMINMKNKFSFLHPQEVMEGVENSLPLNHYTERTSNDKRNTSILYRPEERITFCHTESDDYDEDDHDEADITSISSLMSPVQQFVAIDSLQPSASNGIEPQDIEPQVAVTRPPSISSNASMFGYGTTDVDRYLARITRRNPNLRIPPIRCVQGKQILFDYWFISHEML